MLQKRGRAKILSHYFRFLTINDYREKHAALFLKELVPNGVEGEGESTSEEQYEVNSQLVPVVD